MDLQRRGEELIKELGLQELLDSYGEAYLVGNLALGTTVKPDIDFQIYPTSPLWTDSAKDIAKEIAQKTNVSFRLYELKKSKKLLLSINLIDNGINWDIHITFTNKNGDYLTDSYKFLVDYQDRLTDDDREVIKRLKQHYLRINALKNSISYYIYRAVLDEGISSLSDFEKYLKDNNLPTHFSGEKIDD